MEEAEVLIAGAGPVGLFLATELLRRGRRCTIVERNDEPSNQSKALALMPRTLEIFELAGLRDEFANATNRVDSIRFVTPRSSARIAFGSLDTSYPYVAILPQWKTEAILARRLRDLGGRVRYGCEVTGLEQESGGVRVRLSENGRERRAAARYVVGCDGVHSTVREQAGIAFDGDAYAQGALLADVPVRTSVPRNEARVHVHGGGVTTVFPIDDRLRRFVAIAPSDPLPEHADREYVQQRLLRAGLGEMLAGEPVWSRRFRVHRRVARAMRSANVFIAGDAAHAHSPVGGQGMNIGLQDAWNLGWKLAEVLAGRAGAVLLDSYERERLPVARGVVARTDLLTKALAHPFAPAVLCRELLAPALARIPAVHRPIVRQLSQLDMPYAKRMPDIRLRDGTNLYRSIGPSFAIVARVGGYPRVSLPGIDFFEAPMEEERERLTLVRPDGYIVCETYVTNLDESLNALLERARA